MSSTEQTASISKGRLWAGRIIGGLPALKPQSSSVITRV